MAIMDNVLLNPTYGSLCGLENPYRRGAFEYFRTTTKFCRLKFQAQTTQTITSVSLYMWSILGNPAARIKIIRVSDEAVLVTSAIRAITAGWNSFSSSGFSAVANEWYWIELIPTTATVGDYFTLFLLEGDYSKTGFAYGQSNDSGASYTYFTDRLFPYYLAASTPEGLVYNDVEVSSSVPFAGFSQVIKNTHAARIIHGVKIYLWNDWDPTNPIVTVEVYRYPSGDLITSADSDPFPPRTNGWWKVIFPESFTMETSEQVRVLVKKKLHNVHLLRAYASAYPDLSFGGTTDSFQLEATSYDLVMALVEPPPPTITGVFAEGFPYAAVIALNWTPSNYPEFSYYKIYRRRAGESTWTYWKQVTDQDAQIWHDFLIDSGVTYEYKITQVSTDGIESEDSVVASASCNYTKEFIGPLDDWGITIERAFSGSVSDGIDKIELDLWGRSKPLAEFGENTGRTASVSFVLTEDDVTEKYNILKEYARGINYLVLKFPNDEHIVGVIQNFKSDKSALEAVRRVSFDFVEADYDLPL